MEAKAQARFVRVTPQKARRIVNEIRGKSYLEADNLLQFAPQRVARDVRKVLNSAAANAGVIFSPVSINYAQLIVEAAAAQGFEGTILGGDTLDSNMVVEAAKGKDVDVKITTFYQEGGNPEFDAGIKEWINANADAKTNNGGNDMVSAVTVMGYDAYFTALEAIKAAGSTAPADILAALPGVTYSRGSAHQSED